MPYAYPTLMILEESEASTEAGITPQRATNGALKSRRLYSSDKTDFTVVHMLTRAERDTLTTHYTSNRDAEFSFTWPGDGTTYTVRYSGAPQVARRGFYYRVTTRLAQV